jgi:hypothetical protein
VPHTGSEAWTAAIHRKKPAAAAAANRKADDFADEEAAENAAAGIVTPWQPWYNSESPAQVAGYVVQYDSGLTYATVKGAGETLAEKEVVAGLCRCRLYCTLHAWGGGGQVSAHCAGLCWLLCVARVLHAWCNRVAHWLAEAPAYGLFGWSTAAGSPTPLSRAQVRHRAGQGLR